MKIAKFWPGARQTHERAPTGTLPVVGDGLGAFGSEDGAAAPLRGRGALALAPKRAAGSPDHPDEGSRSSGPRRSRAPLQWALVILLSAGATAAGMWGYQRRLLAGPAPGQLTLETTPPGLPVSIAGEAKGVTPVTLTLAPGTYDVQLGEGEQRRTVQATLTAGMSLVQRLEIAPSAASEGEGATGALHVQTEPSRLPVLIDGVEKGISPLTVGALPPGDHEVVVGREAGAVRRTVTVQANHTLSLIISAIERPASSSAGWLTVSSPILLQIIDGGTVIGRTDLERVMLPAGGRTLDLVNESLGYRAQRRVVIAAGRTTQLAIEVPNGTLSINAQPWAEVWLDGRRIGETPIGNLSTPIGSHDILFRHPEFGEHRATVVVAAKQPARIGVDLRKK